jgi:hypothetical protein
MNMEHLEWEVAKSLQPGAKTIFVIKADVLPVNEATQRKTDLEDGKGKITGCHVRTLGSSHASEIQPSKIYLRGTVCSFLLKLHGLLFLQLQRGRS